MGGAVATAKTARPFNYTLSLPWLNPGPRRRHRRPLHTTIAPTGAVPRWRPCPCFTDSPTTSQVGTLTVAATSTGPCPYYSSSASWGVIRHHGNRVKQILAPPSAKSNV